MHNNTTLDPVDPAILGNNQIEEDVDSDEYEYEYDPTETEVYKKASIYNKLPKRKILGDHD